jgi:hypothetical protein
MREFLAASMVIPPLMALALISKSLLVGETNKRTVIALIDGCISRPNGLAQGAANAIVGV